MIGQPELAKTLAAKWITRNYMIYKTSGGKMYEKYNVASECYKTKIELGEYELQEGFGWTNSVVLDLLRTFAGELSFDTQTSANSKCECCRPHPVLNQDSIFTPPQDSVCQMPSETIETPSLEQQLVDQQNALAVAAILTAEIAQNAPGAIINDVPSLIRAV